MAVSNASRPTPANLVSAATATAKNQRKTDVLLAMRETLERANTLADIVPNTRFQGRTQVMSYELKRNKTTISRSNTWDGGQTGFDAKTSDTFEFESMELPWTELRNLYKTEYGLQEAVESQIDPGIELGEAHAAQVIIDTEDDIYALIRDYNKSAVVYNYATGATRSQYIVGGSGYGVQDASNYLADDQQKTGTKPFVYNLFRIARSKLIRAYMLDGRTRTSQQTFGIKALIDPDVHNELIDEFGARGVDGLVTQEIEGTGKVTVYGDFTIYDSVLCTPKQINVTTGATVQSGGKMAYPVYFFTNDCATIAFRDVMERTLPPLSPGNDEMKYKGAYTSQQLLAIDDDRFLWEGFIRHEA